MSDSFWRELKGQEVSDVTTVHALVFIFSSGWTNPDVLILIPSAPQGESTSKFQPFRRSLGTNTLTDILLI